MANQVYSVAVLILAMSLGSLVYGIECPTPYEKCLCFYTSYYTVNCYHVGWTSLPQATNIPNVGRLAFLIPTNRITSIPAGALPPNIVDLNMSENPLSHIDPDAFADSVSTLSTIQMSNVTFTRIPDAFGRLQKLTSFELKYASIADWNEDVFALLGNSVDTLILQDVGLTSWPNWLHHFTNLTVLTIESDSISAIPDDAFKSVPNAMHELNLKLKQLTHIPKALNNLTIGWKLIFDGCQLTNFTGLPDIWSLVISSAGLREDSQLFTVLPSKADSLTFLDLSNNELNTIPNIAFMSVLNSLTVNGNKISHISPGHLPDSLTELRLKYNKLMAIPVAVSTLPNLSRLDLESNGITEIKEGDFPIESLLEYLGLNGNPLAQIAPGALDNLPNLETLELSDTKLTAVPLALTSLAQLTRVILSRDSLLCPCPVPRELVNWYGKEVNVEAEGSCGDVHLASYLSNTTCSGKHNNSGLSLLYNLRFLAATLLASLLLGLGLP